MTLKGKPSSAGARQDGKKGNLSSSSKMHHVGVPAAKKVVKRRRAAAVETIEARLASKAAAADKKTFVAISLGQMTREKRHKLLYED